MTADPFASDCKFTPFWWDRVPRPAADGSPLPERVDVAGIGSGYTGLHAALQTARAGRSTLVVDAEDADWGCSTRNGGQISTSIKPGFDVLAKRHGEERALAAGAGVVGHCPATSIENDGGGHVLRTVRGIVRARDVVVATNGYTGRLKPWLRRRVIPIGSHVIATEPLPEAQMARLMPKDRIVSDTRKVVFYYRASPDRRRILFGGRVSTGETDPRISGPLLHAEMVKLFPELAAVRISHSWCGVVAYTFDELMHIGKHEGVHFAMGYCGSGVGMASYLGMRLGLQVLGRKEGATALDGLAFQTRPPYSGNPWFLAPSVRYYQWRDRRRS